MMRVPVYVVIGTDPQSGAKVPILCNEELSLAKAAMDEAIDALELTGTTLKPAEQQRLATTLNTLRIVEGVLEIADDA